MHLKFFCWRLVRCIQGISSSLVFSEWAVWPLGVCSVPSSSWRTAAPTKSCPWRAAVGGRTQAGAGESCGEGRSSRVELSGRDTAPLPHYESNGAKFSWQRWFNAFAKCNFTWAVSHPRHLFDSTVKLPEVSDKHIIIPNEYKLLQMIDRELAKLFVMTSSNLVILSLHRKWQKP